jgi:hypothetical protein
MQKGAELGGTGLFFPTWGNRSRTWGKAALAIKNGRQEKLKLR